MNHAQNIKKIRWALRMTLRDFEAATGVNYAHVSMMEKGTRNVTLGTYDRLSEYLKIPSGVLLIAFSDVKGSAKVKKAIVSAKSILSDVILKRIGLKEENNGN